LSVNASDPVVLLFMASPTLTRLEAALAEVGLATLCVSSVDAARQILATQRGDCVAVLDTSSSAPYSVDSAYRLLHQSAPVPTLLLFEPRDDASVYTQQVSPVDDYAYLADPVPELVRRVQVLSRRVALVSPGGASGLQPGGAARFQQGQTIVVYAPKGGVGKSTIAVNLAIALTRLFNKKVALVDADLWFGDASVLLDVRSAYSMASLVAAGRELDAETVRSALVEHPSGVQVLRAPTELLAVDQISPYLPARLAAVCASMFDCVIIDGQPGLDEYMLQVLEGASQILLVLTPEVAVMRSTIRILEVAPKLGWADKLMLVLNRANSGVPLKDVEETIGRPIDVRIRSDGRRIVDAGNNGVPLMLTDPKGEHEITRDLGRLAARIAGEREPQWASGFRLWPFRASRPRLSTPDPAPQDVPEPSNVQDAPPSRHDHERTTETQASALKRNGHHAERPVLVEPIEVVPTAATRARRG
jgi:pilus assembly protein CpaE